MAPRLVFFLWACLALAGEPGASVEVAGGTVAGLRNGLSGRIELTGPDAMVFRHKDNGNLSVPYDRIHTLEYGQKVSRRFAEAILISPALLLAKARKHYVTIGFTDAEGNRQALVFEVGKRHVRALLAGLEAKTGRRVEYLDGEARKRGGG